MVAASYIISFVMLFTLTLSNLNGFVLGALLEVVGVPAGYRNLTVLVLAVPFLGIIIANKKGKILRALWNVTKLWMPWIVYLVIRGYFSIEGVWKIERYLSLAVLPAILFIVMALADPGLFEKYLMKTLLFMNFFLVLALSTDAFGLTTDMNIYGFEGINRMIWLSRGFGISIVWIIATSAYLKRPFVFVPLLLLMFSIMLVIGSRGPVISTIITVGIYYFLTHRKNIIAAGLLITAILTIVLLFFSSEYLAQFAGSFASHKGELQGQSFGADRLSAFIPSMEIFAEEPLVGIGLGQWWSAFRPHYVHPLSLQHRESAMKKLKGEPDYDYPHNVFLEVLSELGVIGIILFLLLFFPFGRFFVLSNEYNILFLLGFLYASSSGDIVLNQAPLIFSSLSLLRARDLLVPLEDRTPPANAAEITACKG